MTKTMFCGECEKRVPFEVRTVSEHFEVRGESFTVEGPAHVCTSCGSVRGDSLFDALLCSGTSAGLCRVFPWAGSFCGRRRWKD
jgi:YgiT-type zinc finger domain-containing protein